MATTEHLNNERKESFVLKRYSRWTKTIGTTIFCPPTRSVFYNNDKYVTSYVVHVAIQYNEDSEKLWLVNRRRSRLFKLVSVYQFQSEQKISMADIIAHKHWTKDCTELCLLKAMNDRIKKKKVSWETNLKQKHVENVIKYYWKENLDGESSGMNRK